MQFLSKLWIVSIALLLEKQSDELVEAEEVVFSFWLK